jgi:hypothetical protein
MTKALGSLHHGGLPSPRARWGVAYTAHPVHPEKDQLDKFNTQIFIKTLIREVINR